MREERREKAQRKREERRGESSRLFVERTVLLQSFHSAREWRGEEGAGHNRYGSILPTGVRESVALCVWTTARDKKAGAPASASALGGRESCCCCCCFAGCFLLAVGG
jgi:hypothetical protein